MGGIDKISNGVCPGKKKEKQCLDTEIPLASCWFTTEKKYIIIEVNCGFLRYISSFLYMCKNVEESGHDNGLGEGNEWLWLEQGIVIVRKMFK